MNNWLIGIIAGGVVLTLAGVKIYLKLKKAPAELSELKKPNLEPEACLGAITPEPETAAPRLAEAEESNPL